MATPCPFCNVNPQRQILAGNDAAVAFYDSYPVSLGHALVVPRRHIGSLFELDPEELQWVWALVAEVRGVLQARHQPGGFNIGVNDGAAAGQTVGHAHIHLIPRYHGDVADPRGGVRGVIPGKAKYW